MKVSKAIIAAAGFGTRMLPVSKAVEKSMIPVGNRPVIDYIVEDLIKAGIQEIYFIVDQTSRQIRNYYSNNERLNSFLKRRGKDELLELVEPPQNVNFHFIVQPSDGRYGTSIPVAIMNDHIDKDESAIVVMGDQFFYREDGGSNAADLIKLAKQKGLSAALFGNPVPKEDVSKFGIIQKDQQGNFVKIFEKPSIEEAPSNLNNSSFYLFDKTIFELANQLPVNPIRGEFEITDVINAYVKNKNPIAVGTTQGIYMECGSLQGWHQANKIIIEKLINN